MVNKLLLPLISTVKSKTRDRELVDFLSFNNMLLRRRVSLSSFLYEFVRLKFFRMRLSMPFLSSNLYLERRGETNEQKFTKILFLKAHFSKYKKISEPNGLRVPKAEKTDKIHPLIFIKKQ